MEKAHGSVNRASSRIRRGRHQGRRAASCTFARTSRIALDRETVSCHWASPVDEGVRHRAISNPLADEVDDRAVPMSGCPRYLDEILCGLAEMNGRRQTAGSRECSPRMSTVHIILLSMLR